MYHIFLIIAAIASQNQVASVQQQFQERKLAYIRSTQPHSDDEIILQLKKQAEDEERAIKPDLESLGLDPVDNAVSKKPIATPQAEAQKAAEVRPEIKPEVKKDPIVAIADVAEKNLPDISITKTPSKDLPAALPQAVVKEESKLTDNSEKTSKDDTIKTDSALAEDTADKDTKDAKKTMTEKVISVTQKPIDKIKEIFDKKKPEEEKKSATEVLAKKDAVQPDVKSINQEKLSEEDKEKAKKKREERIAKKRALADLKQRQRTAKLEELRRKYLQQNEESDDVYEGISHYQTMSKIIPQKKIPPKFFNNEVPPQLLNRFRGPDNRHHPLIMSNSERIDFMFKAIAEDRIDDFNSIFSGWTQQNPDIKNSFGDTLLTFAILMRRYDAISSLISKGANPELANDLGYKPLNIAIEMVDYRSVEILINIGDAKVDFVDELGRTYLMQSARVGSLPITDLLISKGVDVNAADNNGVTALAIAYKHKKDIIAKYLLKYGAKSWVKKDYIDDDNSMVEELFNKWK